VFAAGQFTDAMICYSLPPPAKRGGSMGVWDEFVCGTANRLGWLGKPQGAAVHLAAKTPDRLAGIGTPAGAALAQRIHGRVNALAADGRVVIVASSNVQQEVSFSVRDVPVEGENLVVLLTLKGTPRTGYPRTMARFAEVGVAGDWLSLMSLRPENVGLALRGRGEGPLDTGTGARVSNQTNVKIGDLMLPAYAVHPPYQSARGYVFWCADVDVPAKAELRFHLGMGEKSPQRSDGVWFRVLAAPLKGTTPGPYRPVFEEATKEHAWLPRVVSLADWTGQRIRLKFIADCGPQDNATTDHGYWGDVKIMQAGATEDQVTAPKFHMTWVNEQPFAAAFYFRNVRGSTVNLTFRIEGLEPVSIERLSVHSHPDAMYRVFENGLVVANPSAAPYTFDLASVSPGRKYRRIQATPAQDVQANSGEPVGNRLTLGPLEGLFLQRDGGDGRLP